MLGCLLGVALSNLVNFQKVGNRDGEPILKRAPAGKEPEGRMKRDEERREEKRQREEKGRREEKERRSERGT
jgi:hypothetical protein